MNQKLIISALGLSGCLLAAACASTEDKQSRFIDADDPRRGEQVNRICFSRTIDSFKTVSDRQVILEASPRREYLVETSSCFQLDRAQRIGLTGHGGGCLSRGDIMLVSENIFAGRSNTQSPDRCFIQAMYEWNPDAAEEESKEDSEG
ncbi:DUF6491 family protein [Parvularcula sp. IMCC14364]|uniref:DUF6491 family protein n=1 Tax=Parvularcula sp. IMCC14364 TaxID=3067902 RepID=UPI00274249FF|nr:DUF6491 family protein [Parvularcula sp. IMCC14364]